MANHPKGDIPNTVRGLVLRGAEQLRQAELYYGHGTDNAHDEAVFLVFRALGLAFDVAETELDKPVSEVQCAKVTELLTRRIETRLPTAYLLNEAWFAGLPFFVDPRALIPRSPIAELIERQFAPWITADKVKRLLDIGTGSGCIAIACALAFPEAEVHATDISADALEVAGMNVHRHGVEGQVSLRQADVFGPDKFMKYDLIVANPPYVHPDEIAELPEEYGHEPAMALADGHDGLAIVRKILAGARSRLTTGGVLIVEVGQMQAKLDAEFPDLPFLWLDFERGGEGVFLLERAQL